MLEQEVSDSRIITNNHIKISNLIIIGTHIKSVPGATFIISTVLKGSAHGPSNCIFRPRTELSSVELVQTPINYPNLPAAGAVHPQSSS